MKEIKRLSCNALVVGSGASGYAVAMYLSEAGVTDVMMVTEGVLSGTSRNTGSDKQTYYKLSLSGEAPDSAVAMARDLFAGGAVDGDTALCEAANSCACFMRLCSLGVGFPTDAYGEYVGYKTDHDERGRATSAGPLTSKFMTEALEKRVSELGVQVLGGLRVVEILHDGARALGIFGICDDGFLYSIKCPNIIFATGGPADVYSDTVYPVSQLGSSGVLLYAGALAQNLTEWQYGLASVNPRWNVSGSYMQVLPSFVSVDAEGNLHYFLEEYYASRHSYGLSCVFLKGYEWPFDSRKLHGSSVIDLLVYRERSLGRRVYLDYTRNPFGEIDYESLSKDAREYLSRAGATFGTPIERLKHMNLPAYELYLSKGVNLAEERLEISLCAQHSNGGISVDDNWQSSLRGLFVVGEAAGTHGVYRPGGSALNAGQVGALRAARYIAEYPAEDVMNSELDNAMKGVRLRYKELLTTTISHGSNADGLIAELGREMSMIAGAVRRPDEILAEIEKTKRLITEFPTAVRIGCEDDLLSVYILRDILYARLAILTSMSDFYKTADGGTRGSALYVSEDGELPAEGLEGLRYKNAPDLSGRVQQIKRSGFTDFTVEWRDVRPIPKTDGFFENVWRGYRENKNVRK